jgi:hypothetical protein
MICAFGLSVKFVKVRNAAQGNIRRQLATVWGIQEIGANPS